MEKEQLQEKERSIDILELLRELWDKKVLIILLIVVGLSLMFVKTQFLTADTYTSGGTLYVTNRTDKVIDDYYISQSDVDTARSLTETYIKLLGMRDFMERVGETAGVPYSHTQLASMIKCSIVDETELIQVQVTSGSAEEAHRIAKAFLDEARVALTVYGDGCRVNVVDQARAPEHANGRGMARNLLIGGAVGFVIAAAIVFVKYFFDTKVRSAEDVAKRYNVSILGELAG